MIAKILLVSGLFIVAASIIAAIQSVSGIYQIMANTNRGTVPPEIYTAITYAFGVGLGFLIFGAGLIKILNDKKKIKSEIQ